MLRSVMRSPRCLSPVTRDITAAAAAAAAAALAA